MAGTPNYIQMPPNSTGIKVQTWENTIGGNAVDTEAIVITDSTGIEKATGTNPVRIDPTGTTVQPIDGALTNNNAAPAATLVGVIGALANAANPSWTEGNQVLHSVDLAGNQRVKVNAALPAGTNVIGHVITDSGSTTAVTQATAANLNATVVGTGTFTVQAAQSGTWNIGTVTTVTTVSTVTAVTAISNALPAGTNTIGNVGIVPTTSGGCSVYHVVAAASNNAANIKGSAGQVYGWSIMNNTTYPVFVKLYNETTNPPTPASDTPFKTIGCQAGVSVEGSVPAGLAMGTGIGIAIVKGIADNNNTSVAASDCVVDLYYK